MVTLPVFHATWWHPGRYWTSGTFRAATIDHVRDAIIEARGTHVMVTKR